MDHPGHIIPLLALGAIALAATGATSALGSGAASSTISVVGQPPPTNPFAKFQSVTGMIPRFRSDTVDLTRVNRTVSAVVEAQEYRSGAAAKAFIKANPAAARQGIKGRFRVGTDRKLISASETLISVLMPAVSLPPGGTTGDIWISATMRVPAGRPTALASLLRFGARDIPAILKLARASAYRLDACLRLGGATSSKSWMVAPTPANYRQYALTPAGLAIGFNVSTIASPACGRTVGVIAYGQVSRFLNTTGRRLVKETRRPRFASSH